ncbi:MAG: branched-chain amino acid ABC transporter permease [Candidatus Bathyarchaeia archaeon]
MFKISTDFIAKNKRLIGFFFLASAILLIVPSFGNPFLTHSLFLSFLYAFMALAWNLLCGYGGQFSLGHHLYFGVGAYVTAVLLINLDLTPWIGMLVSGIVCAALAALVSLPLFQLRLQWFTIATMVVAEIFKIAFTNWDAVGGGKGLLLPMKPPSIYWLRFAEPDVYYYIMLGLLAIEAIILYRIINGKIGHCLQVIREDEYAAMSVGINSLKYKTIALVIGGFFCGIAGGFYTAKYRFIDPFSTMDYMISVEVALVGIIGGVYTFIGPIIGSLLVIPVSNYVRAAFGAPLGGQFFGVHRLIYGCVLLVAALFMQEGIVGWTKRKGYTAFIKGGGK